ncbi:MAG: hypothetical protein AB4042_04295 [Leptolyngbyaceae cyanobacterium]
MSIGSFQDMIDAIERLSVQDQEELFELIRKRRLENRRLEIAAHAQILTNQLHSGQAKVGSVDDLIADLLDEDDEDCLG